MVTNLHIFICSIVCLTVLASCGHPEDNRIIIGETVTVVSQNLNKEMIIDIRLPEGYSESQKKYPVLFTCQSTFLHVSGVADDLKRKNSIPELIVISIRNYNSDDFIPEKIEGRTNSAGADKFIAFFEDELIPLIDSNYRTEPFRIFYSGSFGGGFAVYSFLTQPDVFNSYLSATPAINFEGISNLIMENIEAYISGNTYENRFLFMGVEEDQRLLSVLDEFINILSYSDLDNAKWEYHEFFDEDHGSIPNKVIYHGLKFTFADWSTIPDEIVSEGINATRDYLSVLENKYGYDIGISPIAIWKISRSLRNENKYDQLTEFIKLALEKYPDKASLWLQLGRTYETLGQLDSAKQVLETAYQKAVDNQSTHLGIFNNALEKVKSKLQNN